jgi:polar amino acid transport system substrate-binding protein
MKTNLSRAVALLCAAAMTAFAAGCGRSDDDSSSNSTSTQAAPATTIALPAALKAKGTLKVATDATYAPNEFVAPDGKTVIGMDVDLGEALGRLLGVKFEFVKAGFDAIIPGLAAGKYDIGMSSFTDSKEREKTVDFVTYFTAGTSFFVKAQGGPSIGGLADLCGHKVAAEKGTVQVDAAEAQSKKCKAAGKGTVDVLTFPDQNGANLALSSGRAEVGLADSPVVDYAVKKSDGQFKLTGTPYDTAPYGIAVPKGKGLAQPLLKALQELMRTGEYRKILAKWGVESGAIDNPVINGATS